MATIIECLRAKQPEVAAVIEKLWGPFVVDFSDVETSDCEHEFYRRLMEEPPRPGRGCKL